MHQPAFLLGPNGWVVPTKSGTSEDETGALAAALATSNYVDMLHDRRRAAAYAAALARVVRPGSLVLDVGTGTGLLALLALRAGAGAVVACEQWAPLAGLARRVVAANGAAGAVSVVAARSDEPATAAALRRLGRPADVVVSEILDSALLGEGCLPTMAAVSDHGLLHADGVAVPASARIMACVVACPALRACWAGAAGAPGGVGGDCGPAVRPLHTAPLAAGGGLVPLTPPGPLVDLDLTRPASVRGDALTWLPPAVAAGPADAVVVWWEATLAPGVTLSTAPPWAGGDAGPWTDHWKQTWAPGVDALTLAPGDAVAVRAEWAATSLAVAIATVRDSGGVACPVPPPPPASSYGATDWLWATASPGNAAALTAAAAAAAAVAAAARTAVVTLGDGHLPALAAAAAGADVVAIHEASGAVDATRRVAARVPALAARVTPTILSLALALPPAAPAAAVLAEPHYTRAEAGAPWDALAFWRVLTDLKAAGAVARHALVSPRAARLVAVGLHAPDLAAARGPLGAVEGVDLAVLDAVATPPPDTLLARAAWQCGATRDATARRPVYALDFSAPVAGAAGDVVLPPIGADLSRAGSAVSGSPANGAGASPPRTPTEVHAVAAWFEYDAVPGFTCGRAPAADGAPAPGPHALLVLGTPLDAAAGVRVRARLRWGSDGRPRGELSVVRGGGG